MKRWLLTAAGLLFAHMVRQAHQNNVITHDYVLDGYTGEKPFTVYFISDVHRRLISRRMIHSINEPVDVVIIGGDLTERFVPLKRVRRNLRLLNKLGPVVFIHGNNDQEINRRKLIACLRSEGVTILENDSIPVLKGDTTVTIAGTGDSSREQHDMEKTISSILQPGDPAILVCHNPFDRGFLPESHPFNWILSGHTHGGQIRIFGYGPYSQGGLNEYKGIPHFISNGYGTTQLHLRLGAKPQTHLLRFHA